MSGLWAITCYFNPTGSRRRLENYRTFRRRLTVPLVAVELSYGPSFELTVEDADVLLPLRGRDVLWQKERLLNLALPALPRSCDAVAWLDCDIVFQDRDWHRLAQDQLQRYVLLQPFTRAYALERQTPLEAVDRTVPSVPSLAYNLAARMLDVGDLFVRRSGNRVASKTGLAWAGRRDVLERHGFYDAAIIGGGDRALAYAALGCWAGLERPFRLNRRQRQHYQEWAEPFYRSVEGSVGYVAGDLVHLWHGERADRGYRKRFEGLEPFDFDPFVDLALDEGGCWRWNTEKPALHQYVENYFHSRNEDGVANPTPVACARRRDA
jgi:hypothetical protein